MAPELVKRRLKTIFITLSLLMIAAILYFLHEKKVIYESPIMPLVMLTWTAIYVFGSCVLQTFNKLNGAVALGVVVFFILCTALFYSDTIIDFVTFFVCMSLVIRKSTKICQCFKDCQNPLK